MERDFAAWYTDVVVKGKLVAYSGVRGCVYFHPYGTAIWENIRAILDAEFKKTNHQNVMLPMLIPESMFMREKEHIEGFAPEVAYVTHFGTEKLSERLIVRPTSEVLFCDYFKQEVQSYRDLPKLLNQWANIVRCEKTTRPFLRTLEFYWQEGHTLHETEAEAREETTRMLEIYKKFVKDYLALPVISGRKTEREKFAGAVETYTIEAMMHDGKALQSGTSHYLGQNFAKSFDIKFLGRDGKLTLPHQTSWGVSTRLMGGMVMAHGDNNGLVLPPRIAPIQAVIIPIAAHKGGVLEAADKLAGNLGDIRVFIDKSDNSPGWKFAEYEMRGVPIRIEIGPKDIESGNCVVVRRDTREKMTVKISELNHKFVLNLVEKINTDMYERALKRRESMTYTAETADEVIKIFEKKTGFVIAPHSEEMETKLKEHAITARCRIEDGRVIWGKAY
jgi:prolyl-tRNA synthetase